MVKNSLNEKEFKELNFGEKLNYVKEWKCVCQECNKKWHYLNSIEKKMESQQLTNSCLQVSFCCNPCVGTATSNANNQLEQQRSKLTSCPECGSSNVKKEAKYHKKEN